MNKLLILLLALWGTPLWAQADVEEQDAGDTTETEIEAKTEQAAPRPATDPFDVADYEAVLKIDLRVARQTFPQVVGEE